MTLRKLLLPRDRSLIRWFYFAVGALQILLVGCEAHAQAKLTPIRTAYSALSAGIGTLWLTHEEGFFRKHGLDSNLIYIRGGSTALPAIFSGDNRIRHLLPGPL